jgi:mono/diheme cytochrome c family protein
MSMRDGILIAGSLALGLAAITEPGLSRDTSAGGPKLGRSVAADVIRGMDLTVTGDGAGLPAGSGTVAEGRAAYAAKCAACHAPAGAGGPADRLTGGKNTLTSAKPIKTVASYWPYAPTLFDYIRRAMPLTAPQSLDDKEVYGLVAYLLSIDGIVPADARLDAASLPKIAMPNRDGFVSLEDRKFDGNLERARKAR